MEWNTDKKSYFENISISTDRSREIKYFNQWIISKDFLKIECNPLIYKHSGKWSVTSGYEDEPFQVALMQ